tara:strand:+ start:5222 stop:5434 length:213 start_codon:yes stop_codon:yes gene_type:complete
MDGTWRWENGTRVHAPYTDNGTRVNWLEPEKAFVIKLYNNYDYTVKAGLSDVGDRIDRPYFRKFEKRGRR